MDDENEVAEVPADEKVTSTDAPWALPVHQAMVLVEILCRGVGRAVPQRWMIEPRVTSAIWFAMFTWPATDWTSAADEIAVDPEWSELIASSVGVSNTTLIVEAIRRMHHRMTTHADGRPLPMGPADHGVKKLKKPTNAQVAARAARRQVNQK